MTLHSVCKFWLVNDVPNGAQAKHNILKFAPTDLFMKFNNKHLDKNVPWNNFNQHAIFTENMTDIRGNVPTTYIMDNVRVE